TRYGRASGRIQAESLWRRGLSQYGGIEAALRWRTGGDGNPAPRAGPFRDQPGRRRSQIEFARTATTANRRTNAPPALRGVVYSIRDQRYSDRKDCRPPSTLLITIAVCAA